MKIRIIKDLPRCEIGQEFEVKNCNVGKFFKAYSRGIRPSFEYYLDEIEDYYEECIDMPRNGEEFWFVNVFGEVMAKPFDFHPYHLVVKYQRHHKTKEEAQAYLDYCKAYKKGDE